MSVEFPKGKEAYCPQCYFDEEFEDENGDGLVIERDKCVHAKQK